MLGLGLSITRAGVGGGNLTLPSGFDWTPPVTVRRSGATFATSFNANEWKVAATADVWVSTTGSDGAGLGTQASPYRTIFKGLQAALALPDAAVNVFVVAGTYNRLYHWNGQKCDKHLNIIASGGRVVSSARFEQLTWTLDTGIYKATRSSVGSVWDEAFTDPLGGALRLVKKTLLADCQSTAGTWYTDGTTVYVHTTDTRSPDASVIVGSSLQNAVFDVNKKWYIEGFDFEAGANPFNSQAGTVGSGSRIVFNDCKFRYGVSGTNGMSILGIPQVIAYNCAAYSNEADGFNYHGSTLETKAVEINCTAYANGLPDGVDNDNASTSHEASRVLRVNGNYYATIGPTVCDINNAKSWNLGCQARNAAATASTSDSDSGFRVQDAASMWLDTCVATGSTYATSSASTGGVNYRGLTYDGILHGATPY